jgi:Type II secretion system (T2SS), protein M subtype b
MRVTISGLHQRWLALAILAVVSAALWFFVGAPLWETAALHEQRVAMLRDQAARLQALVDAEPRFAAAARQLSANPNVRALAFEGAQPSVSVADLQAAVSRVFAGAGATVSSSETIAAWPGGTAGEIAVQTTVEADIGALVAALHAIGGARPLMKVERLSVREPDAEWAAAVPVGPQPDVANKLIVDIVISASTRRAP